MCRDSFIGNLETKETIFIETANNPHSKTFYIGNLIDDGENHGETFNCNSRKVSNNVRERKNEADFIVCV